MLSRRITHGPDHAVAVSADALRNCQASPTHEIGLQSVHPGGRCHLRWLSACYDAVCCRHRAAVRRDLVASSREVTTSAIGARRYRPRRSRCLAMPRTSRVRGGFTLTRASLGVADRSGMLRARSPTALTAPLPCRPPMPCATGQGRPTQEAGVSSPIAAPSSGSRSRPAVRPTVRRPRPRSPRRSPARPRTARAGRPGRCRGPIPGRCAQVAASSPPWLSARLDAVRCRAPRLLSVLPWPGAVRRRTHRRAAGALRASGPGRPLRVLALRTAGERRARVDGRFV